jgi:hypothetical protein
MSALTLHNQVIDTVFDLLGQSENDLTCALGWTLARAPQFLTQLGKTLGLTNSFSDRVKIRLQEYALGQGVTDIEIDDPGLCHIILEAKQGFAIPSNKQLVRYASRLKKIRDRPRTKLLVVLAEDARENTWLRPQVPHEVNGITTKTISWRHFIEIAKRVQPNGPLQELIHYLGRATTMQNQNSNLVYVVSLSNKPFSGLNISGENVVEKHNKYFHIGGTGGGWPFDPPNYLGFRYKGELKSIHHVESYEVINNFKPHFTHASKPTDRPYFLYRLGPAIKPPHPVPTNGKRHKLFRSARKWIYIDLLLTAGSVAEAAHLTKKRDTEFSQDIMQTR